MTTALLVIDVQQSFQQRPSWADIDLPDIADRCATLVASARHRNERVIWILHDEPGTNDVFDPATGYCTFIDGLRPLDEEPVLHKTAHNAFTTTSLARELTLGGVDTVRISGIRTEQCCETTARVASDLGYTVEFVLDATATTPLTAAGVTLTPAQLKERTAAVLDGRFAIVTSMSEVLSD